MYYHNLPQPHSIWAQTVQSTPSASGHFAHPSPAPRLTDLIKRDKSGPNGNEIAQSLQARHSPRAFNFRRKRTLGIPLVSGKKKPDTKAGLSCVSASCRLTLGVLGTLTRFPQTHFLTLNFAIVTGNVTRLPQRWTKRLVIVHQGPGQTMPNRTGLAA